MGLLGAGSGSKAGSPRRGFEDDVETLRLAVTALAQARGGRTLSVLGHRPGAGATTVAASLACSLAREPRPTLLVDANHANPCLHELFQVDGEPGFADLVAGRVGADEAVRPTTDPNLSVLPFGRRGLPVATSPEQCRTLLRSLDGGSLVIIDAGSADAPSALAVGAASPGVVLVVKCGDASREEVESTRVRLSLSGAELWGLVLNQQRYFVPEAIYRRL